MTKNEMTLEEMKYLNMISTETRGKIYQMLYVGITAYNMLMKENPDLKKSKFFINIKSRLLTFLIYRQFDEDMLSEAFPLKVDIDKVNKFGYNSLMLSNNKVKISLAKTKNKLSLPNKSKYRLKHCRDNYSIETQFKFNFESDDPKIIPAQKYVILGFKVRHGELEYLNYMIPDSSMEQAILNLSLTDEYYRFILDTKEEPETEERIATIKTQAEKLINKG